MNNECTTNVCPIGQEHTSQPAGSNKNYPELINKMLLLCVKDTEEIRGALAGRVRSYYKTVFANYKEKMNAHDRAIINSGLRYIYEFSRINSIPKETAEHLISNRNIPLSHIITYTSKDVLKQIAKQYGISCSNKKSEAIVLALRDVMELN